MKNVFSSLIKIAVGLLTLYVAFSVWISFRVNWLLNEVYNTHGTYSAKVSAMVTDKELYQRLDYRDGYSDYAGEVTEIHKRSFPMTIHCFLKAETYYRYTYEKHGKNSGEELGGSWSIPVRLTVELKNWRWVVTEKQEAP